MKTGSVFRTLSPAYFITCFVIVSFSSNASGTEQGNEFFERKIRPALHNHCFECHTSKSKGGLRLDTRESIIAGGDSGPAIFPGKPDRSRLISAIRYGADSEQMPPKKKLPEDVIKDFEKWIQLGAPWPENQQATPLSGNKKSFKISEEDKNFWAFQPIRMPEIPEIKNSHLSNNEIDLYVLEKLEAEGTKLSTIEGKRAIIRRATYDLTGLPPTPQEVDNFLKDHSEDSFLKVIDRLLDSPRYGEHWARHWLDGVRYVSDVGYYNFSDLGWRYRDWVIRSLNNDLPYDQFIIHQIAGDLLPDPNGRDRYADGIIATGVLSMGNYDDQESDKEKLYSEVIDDQIDLVGRQFLGLTLACARCHDHKSDPISTADYYALGGIFMSSQILETKSRIGAHRLKVPLESENDKKYYASIKDQIDDLKSKLLETDSSSPEKSKTLTAIARLQESLPSETGVAIGVREGGYENSRHKKIGDMPIYIRGNPYKLGNRAPRNIPSIFTNKNQPTISELTDQSGRLELAHWIANEENPLTARVMVNRIWQYHFGKGLVQTPSNFGQLGLRPSHPELLDFLASKFIQSGWSMKAMHRLIMSSATYQQSSQSHPLLKEKDAENILLGRFSNRRLTAEEIHDSLLAISNQLNPGVGHQKGNRAVYSRVGHEFRSLIGGLFDAPATGTISPKRTESTTAPQALYMMNDPSVIKTAKLLTSTLSKTHSDYIDRIEQAYSLIFSRPPNDRERLLGLNFLKDTDVSFHWMYFHSLLCTNEFLYLD